MLSYIPDGYKIASQDKSDIGSILEFIPENETLARWNEMLTVLIVHNVHNMTLSQYRTGVERLWARACPGGSAKAIERGSEQHRPILIWSQKCPFNIQTGKPETTLFKVTVRDGNILVVQKAFRFEPSAEQLTRWITFLREVRIDDRL